MKTVRARSEYKQLRTLAIAVVWLAIAGAARADLMASNAAGVKAGITKIAYNASAKSVGVQFLVTAPTSTNVTTFTIQKSFDLETWTNYSSSVTVTGSLPLTQISDFVAASNQFYRMQLINFQ
jgi:hypothetical protein